MVSSHDICNQVYINLKTIFIRYDENEKKRTIQLIIDIIIDYICFSYLIFKVIVNIFLRIMSFKMKCWKKMIWINKISTYKTINNGIVIERWTESRNESSIRQSEICDQLIQRADNLLVERVILLEAYVSSNQSSKRSIFQRTLFTR